MADRVDAAIAALQVALKEAENSRELFWKARRANCWINQLPGAWWGRWRHLKLCSDYVGDMQRVLFISDLRAVLAYLGAHRDEIKIATAYLAGNLETIEEAQSEMTPEQREEFDDKRQSGKI